VIPEIPRTPIEPASQEYTAEPKQQIPKLAD